MTTDERFIIVDDYDEVAERIEGPFNPFENQSASESEMEICKNEFRDAHERILETALKFGKRKVKYGEGEFSMTDDFFLSRGITILIENEKLIRKELLEALQSILKELKEDYAISVQAKLDGEYLYVGISKEDILGYSDRPLLLEKFGFQRKGNQPEQ